LVRPRALLPRFPYPHQGAQRARYLLADRHQTTRSISASDMDLKPTQGRAAAKPVIRDHHASNVIAAMLDQAANIIRRIS
jgi:hypothetical protein